MGIIVRPTKDDEFNFSVGKISLSNSLACDRARSFYILFFFEGWYQVFLNNNKVKIKARDY